MEITVPSSALPDNKPLRRQFLDEYFPSDLIPFERIEDNHWKIATFIPDNPSFYIDPFIEKTLQQWHEAIPIESIGYYWRIYKNAMLSMNDSWSLYYWALVIDWLKIQSSLPPHIVLFHVDDHKDMGSPLTVVNENAYECLFTKQKIDFNEPETVRQGIMEKSINIRSFITLLLHELESIQILHLRYSHIGKPKESRLATKFEYDSLISQDKKRPITMFEDEAGKHTYCVSSDPDYLSKKIPENSLVLLHVDCDGFNNRYNGDSRWDLLKPSIDLNLTQIKEKISELLQLISNTSSQIYMNVALSPGFFPSEYWINVSKHIFSEAEKYGIVQDGPFSQHLHHLHPKEILDAAYS